MGVGSSVGTGVSVGGGKVGASVGDSVASVATSGSGAFGVLEGVGGIEVGTSTCTAVGGAGVATHAKETIISRTSIQRANEPFFIKTLPIVQTGLFPTKRPVLSIMLLSGWVKCESVSRLRRETLVIQ
jgi:hypothetical protein